MFYALIVGNDVYDDKEFANLSGAVRDARKLADFIRTRFPSADCYGPGQVKIAELTNPTSGEVRRAFGKIVNLLDDDSVFFFYFSGHGICLNGEDQPSLLCRDAMEALLDGAIGAGEIAPRFITSMSRRGRGDMFFCFDVCRSAVFTGHGVFSPLKTSGLCRAAVSKKGRGADSGNRCALTSCRDRERASDDGSFVDAILAEWESALVSNQGVFIGWNFVKRVSNRLRAKRLRQRPELVGTPLALTPGAKEGTVESQKGNGRTFAARASLAAAIGLGAGVVVGLIILAAVLFSSKKSNVELPGEMGEAAQIELDISAWQESSTRQAGTRQTMKIGNREYGFVWIPAGEFDMGSPESENDRNFDETLHHVKLTKGFWMLETETTQALYEGVMDENPCRLEDDFLRRFEGDNLPIGCVSWNDAMKFCAELTKRLPKGLKASLPTEAQWEYACRAGTTTAYSYGDSADSSKMNYNSDGMKTVKSYEPNPWGLYDMHGNVDEWCLDYYGDYPTGIAVDPKGPKISISSFRVFRGGHYGGVCRSANRGSFYADRQCRGWGFRFLLSCD